MPRADLLALTSDDLATLTNRGTVKRAQKELDACEVTCEIQENDGGDILFAWSDGITCRFPAGKSVHDAVCSSGLAGISRHIIRSVLEYQRIQAESGGLPSAPESPSSSPDPVADVEDRAVAPSKAPIEAPNAANRRWDPGAISDEALIAQFRKTAITQARKRFEQGVLVELTRGAKPVARFLDENCTIRFLVPDDLRYVSADCAEALWSTWVPLAVWAFRELPADRPAGLLCLQQVELPVPQQTLESLDKLLLELYRSGLQGVGDTWPQRLGRVEQSLRGEGLVWPAELVVDLLQQCELYQQHDARFEPRQVVQLLGELTARARAIRRDTRTVPQPLIRGSKSDRPIDIAGGRFIGVGLGVRPGKRHTTISAYLQDADSGSVVAVERTYADPYPASGDKPRSYASLASTVLVRGISLGSLATSQLLLKSGKRTPSGQLVLPRIASNLTAHPQNFQWEQLKAPFAVENFSQLAARFETLPPSYLRPRRRTENLHVIAVNGADEAMFDIAQQKLTARLRDSQGDVALLTHPYHGRAREGFNQVLDLLQQRGSQVRFVCGHVRSNGRLLEIQPVSLILEEGDRRLLVQPWLGGNLSTTSDGQSTIDGEEDEQAGSESVVAEFWLRLGDQLSDLLLTGLNQGQPAAWSELATLARQLGFVRVSQPISDLAEAFGQRSNTLRWDAGKALREVRELCLLARLAAE